MRSTRRAKGRPERVRAYLARCEVLLGRVEGTLKALKAKGVAEAELAGIRDYAGHARRQMDQVERRLLKGETRWVAKGKAGRPVELGVPVSVVEDQYQFILHHKIQWTGGDVDGDAQAVRPDLRACISTQPAEPGAPGRIAGLERRGGRRRSASGSRTRRSPPRAGSMAVESAINALEHRGLDDPWRGRVRAHRGAVGAGRQPAPAGPAVAPARTQAAPARRLSGGTLQKRRHAGSSRDPDGRTGPPAENPVRRFTAPVVARDNATASADTMSEPSPNSVYLHSRLARKGGLLAALLEFAFNRIEGVRR